MTAPAQPTPTHDTPILVIDDDSPICKMLVEILTMEDYTAAMALIPYDHPAAAAAATLHALQHATRPTIILADPMELDHPGTAALTAYLQNEAQRQPHLLYLMTALREEDAAKAMNWLHADGILQMPIELDALFALIADGERILRERAAIPPDPFTIAF